MLWAGLRWSATQVWARVSLMSVQMLLSHIVGNVGSVFLEVNLVSIEFFLSFLLPCVSNRIEKNDKAGAKVKLRGGGGP